METILVTGIAGFIGSRIAEKLISQNYKVIGVDDLSEGNLDNVPKGCDFINLDLISEENYSLLPKKCDYIMHLAGQSSGEISFENPALDLKKNAITTLNLINYCIKSECKKLLYASSMSVYGNQLDNPVKETLQEFPISCYGLSKFTAEKYLEIFKDKINYVSVRMFNVYGPGQNLLNLKQGMVSIYLAQAIFKKEILVKGSLQRFRDFIYIDDVVNTWITLMKNNTINNTEVNLGTGKKTYVHELLDLIKKLEPNKNLIKMEGTKGDQSGIFACTKRLSKVIDIDSFVNLETGIKLFYDSILNS